MPFKRTWDSTCPRVWDEWTAGGVKWVIQDLLPEDDEKALKMLLEQFVPDEVLCISTGATQDPVSMRSMTEFWRGSLAQRTSLACYAETAGKKTLAGLNCCIVSSNDDKDDMSKIEGEAWQNVLKALSFANNKVDSFKYLGVDKLLYGMGLVVDRDHRGAKLGCKILEAREPLCHAYGIAATSTVFTGTASQKTAERANFTTIATISLQELAEAGLKFPRDNNRVIKVMAKKYA